MRKTCLIIILILSIVLVTCETEPIEFVPEPEPEIYNSIIGEWTWKRSYNGWAGEYTPDSTGVHFTLNFLRNGKLIIDNNGHIYTPDYYLDEKFKTYLSDTTEVLFIITDTFIVTEPIPVFFVTPDDFQNYFILRRFPNEILLTEDMYDASSHTFVRDPR